MIKYKITKSNLHIPDSYLIEKKKFSRILAQIKGIHPDSDVWKRSFLSLSREWAVHSLAYILNICRDRTKDVDLESEQKWWMSALYYIIGNIALLIIR